MKPRFRAVTIFIGSLWLILQLAGCGLFKEDTRPTSVSVEMPARLARPPKAWIDINSGEKRLTVHRPGMAPVVFDRVAFGAAGVREKRRQGDHVTPSGKYKVGWISRESKFNIFIGLNYPSEQDAARGYKSGVITEAAYSRIRNSHGVGSTPPQTTPLGGYIGIHGIGKGDPEIHRIANWTEGCIALDNQQIRKLVELVFSGMDVVIR